MTIGQQRKLNISMLAKIMGWLLMIEGGFMIFPAVASLCYHEEDWMMLALCSVGTILVGYIMNRWIRPTHKILGRREGLLLTASVWVVFSLFGMVPFMVCQHRLGVVDAFFESMAGFTTTGCSSYKDIEIIGHGLNLWRALMQWIGGMGIILFTLAVIPMLNHSGGMQMFNAEVTGITHDKTKPRISATAKSLWGVYISLTVICFVFLWLGPMDFFDSLCHSFGILSTGGFSTRGLGVHEWNNTYIDIVVTVFMFLGGANFSMIYFAVQGKFSNLRDNMTLRVYAGTILLAFVVIAISLVFSGYATSWQEVTVKPMFQVVSTITSTGYVVPGLMGWGALTAAVLVPLMFCGGCAGSTSGGAKVDRMIVLAKYARNSVRQTLQPNQVTQVVINRKVMPRQIVSKAVAFVTLFVILIIGGGILLSIVRVPMTDAFFSSLACITNTGIGGQDLGLGMGFAEIPAFGKIVLSFLMLVGRLEVFTVLLIFSPEFWRN